MKTWRECVTNRQLIDYPASFWKQVLISLIVKVIHIHSPLGLQHTSADARVLVARLLLGPVRSACTAPKKKGVEIAASVLHTAQPTPQSDNERITPIIHLLPM